MTNNDDDETIEKFIKDGLRGGTWGAEAPPFQNFMQVLAVLSLTPK